jgi:hypothetical protein
MYTLDSQYMLKFSLEHRFYRTVLGHRAAEKVIGLSASQFHALHAELRQRLEAVRLGGEGERKEPGAGRPRELTTEDQLLLFFMWLRNYHPEDYLEWLFEIDRSNINRYVTATAEVLFNLLAHEIKLPERAERDAASVMLNVELRLSVVVDGTPQAREKPGDRGQNELYFSGKDRSHCFNVLLACSPTGVIYWVGPSSPGSTPDLVLAFSVDARTGLWSKMEADEGVGVDKGFVGLDDIIPTVIIPYTERNGHILTADQEEWNNTFAQYRTVVENVFSHLKNWGALAGVWRHSQEMHHKIWVIAAALHNRYTAPLRRY